MWKYLGYFVLIATILERCEAQDPTTTPAPTIVQNISVNPSQIVNFTLPGGRLLGLLSLLTSLSNRFGGGFMGRCFGAAKKLKILIPFFLYKLGVITTTLGFLTMFTLKGLVIGIILLVLNAGGWLAKIGFIKGQQYGQHGGWGGGYGGGHGHMHGWQSQKQPPVHIHVHKDRNDHSSEGYISYNPPPGYSSSYDSYSSDMPPGGGSYGGAHGGHGGGLGGGSYGAYGRGHSVGGSGPDYEPAGGAQQSWAERISKGLQATRTLAERVELIDLYTRLGFNVNDLIGGELKRSGHALVYPKRITPGGVVTPDPSNPIR